MPGDEENSLVTEISESTISVELPLIADRVLELASDLYDLEETESLSSRAVLIASRVELELYDSDEVLVETKNP